MEDFRKMVGARYSIEALPQLVDFFEHNLSRSENNKKTAEWLGKQKSELLAPSTVQLAAFPPPAVTQT